MVEELSKMMEERDLVGSSHAFTTDLSDVVHRC